MSIVVINGSWGELSVAAPSGIPLLDPDDPKKDYPDVVWVDFAEWQQAYPDECLADMAAIDILDVGFVRLDNTYVPPEEDWRAEWRRWQEEDA